MIFTHVEVEYKELRSSGYPSFSNRTFGLNYRVQLEDQEEAEQVRRGLLEKAIRDVKLLHGDDVGGFKLILEKKETTLF